MLRVMNEYVLELDRDITMSERFWHSWLCLYQRERLLEKYPKIKEGYSAFKNVVIKNFGWENYIYKGLLIISMSRRMQHRISMSIITVSSWTIWMCSTTS